MNIKDWLGSARISSAVSNETIIDDRAFSPYGEIYATFGSTAQNENIFTGDTQDVNIGLFDTPNREFNIVGRWINPDPSGVGWNQYAYATNPNSFVDPSGLNQCAGSASSCYHGSNNNPAAGGSGLPECCGESWGGAEDDSMMFYSVQGTVGADNGTVSAETNTYFDLLEIGTQGDVTQERDDSEPFNPDDWGLGPSIGGPCSGPGVPCKVVGTAQGNHVGRFWDRVTQHWVYGVYQNYVYQVEDVNGALVPVDSVTEVLKPLVEVNSNLLEPTTWSGVDLVDGAKFTDQLSNYGPTEDGSSLSVLLQTFFATAGGTIYPLTTQNLNVVSYGPGGPTGTIGTAFSHNLKP